MLRVSCSQEPDHDLVRTQLDRHSIDRWHPGRELSSVSLSDDRLAGSPSSPFPSSAQSSGAASPGQIVPSYGIAGQAFALVGLLGGALAVLL
jgi:hypothetical protein